jgi:hypothetical protein
VLHGGWLAGWRVQSYNLGLLFGPNVVGLRLYLYQMERLLETHLPPLFAHLRSEEVEVSIFASKWFTTLFVYTLPLPMAAAIFDLFLLKGANDMAQLRAHTHTQLLERPLEYSDPP